MRRRRTDVKGFIYLLHFDRPYKHARHYIGWAKGVDKRVGEHYDGSGKSNPLLLAASAAGIAFHLARVWEGKTRNDERRIKNQGGASRKCPLCKEERRAA